MSSGESEPWMFNPPVNRASRSASSLSPHQISQGSSGSAATISAARLHLASKVVRRIFARPPTPPSEGISSSPSVSTSTETISGMISTPGRS